MYACIHTNSYILLAVGTYTYTHHFHIGTCRCPRKRANSTLSLTMDRMVLIPATSSPLELSCTIISRTYATTYIHFIHFRYLTQQVTYRHTTHKLKFSFSSPIALMKYHFTCCSLSAGIYPQSSLSCNIQYHNKLHIIHTYIHAYIVPRL